MYNTKQIVFFAQMEMITGHDADDMQHGASWMNCDLMGSGGWHFMYVKLVKNSYHVDFICALSDDNVSLRKNEN